MVDLLLLLTQAYANPTGGQVTAGSAVISSQNANTLHINQSTDKAVINWQTFNVNANEKVQFHQPTAQSITLNRVNPHNGVSKIFGSVTANGRVWLINPAGIWFGPSAYVNVAGLLATTANISNEDFMSGNYHFVQSPEWHGSIVNEGTIIANKGAIALFAPGVKNTGLVAADLGQVVIASGSAYTLDFYGDNLIQYQVDPDFVESIVDQHGNVMKERISNSGKIQAYGGKIIMTVNTAREMLNSVINTDGIITVKTAALDKGEIVLSGGDTGTVKISGVIDANGQQKGEQGGAISITGKNIFVNHANIDASGDIGGGEILIGGNAHGNGPLRNSVNTVVGSDVVLNANAITTGNGGKVIIWADNGTVFNGSITANGGAFSGNGGFVETSGKEILNITGAHVSASSRAGQAGVWLLDPRNVAIDGSSTTCGSAPCFSAADPTVYTPDTNSSHVDVADILAALEGGTSVTITTGTTGVQAGNIAVNTAISKSAGTTPVTLELNAAGNITVNNPISSASGELSLNFMAGNAITIADNITTNGGNFYSESANATSISGNAVGYTLNTGSGTVEIHANTDGAGGQDFTMGNNSSIITTNNTANAVRIYVNNAGGTGIAALRSITTGDGGTISVTTNTNNSTSGGDITQPAGLLDTGTGTINFVTSDASGIGVGTSGANIVLITGHLNAETGNAGVYITNSGTGSLDIGNVMTNGNGDFALTSTNSSGITNSADIIVGDRTTIDAGTTQNVTLDNAGNDFAKLFITSANNVIINDANDIQLDTSVISGDFTLVTNGAISQNNDITVNGKTTLTAGSSNDITLNDINNDFNSISIISAKNVNLRDKTALEFYDTAVSGSLTVLTAGSITQIEPVSVIMAASFTAGANPILLTNASNAFSDTVTLSNSGSNDISLTNSLPISIAGISAGQNVTLVSGGSMTQTGSISSGSGTTTLVVTSADSDITFNDTSNDFGSSGIVFSGVLSNFRDISLATSNSSAAIPDFTGLDNLRNLTLNFSNTGITLPSLTLHNGGNLNITANGVSGGAINQSGSLIIPGTSSFTATTGTAANRTITLTDAGNIFSGAIYLTNSGGADINVNNSTAMLLGDVNMGNGQLTLSGDGISQLSGTAIAQTSNADFINLSGRAGNVDLTNTGNTMTGVIQAVNTAASTYEIFSSSALKLGDTTLQDASNLFVSAAGITQNSNTSINVGTGNITLDAGSNTLTTNNNDTIFSTGVITLTADTMNLSTHSGSQIGGTALGIGAASTIIIEPSTVGTSIGLAGGAGFLSLSVNELGKFFGSVIRIGNSTSGAVDVNTGATWTPAANFASSGTFILQTGGAITQGGGVDLSASGAAIAFRNASSVDFSNASNVIGGIAADVAGDLVLQSNNPLEIVSVTDNIGTINGILSTGSVTLTSGSTISEAGTAVVNASALSLTGVGGLALGNNNAIAVFNAANSGGGDISLKNTGTLEIASITQNAGGLSVMNTGAITLSGSTALGGAAIFSSGGGDIMFNASLTGGYDLSLNAGTTGNIIFNASPIVDAFSIAAVNNFTNNATITANSFTQSAGMITELGAGGFDISGNVEITANTVNGNINAGSLLINLTYANLTGSVAGSTGQAGADEIVLAKPIPTGVQFFDGIDLAYRNPLVPSESPLPSTLLPFSPALIEPSIIFGQYLSNTTNHITVFSLLGIDDLVMVSQKYNHESQCVITGSSTGGDCVVSNEGNGELSIISKF